MLSDEEKKAIKKVKYICDKWYDESLEIDVKWLESLLSLCEKQSKEIEELKEDRKKYPIAMNDKQYKKVIELAQKDIKEELDRQINARIVNEEFIETNFISKDKIKNKIKDLMEYYEKEVNPEMYHWGDFTAEEYYAGVIAELKSLLEKE